ncbi:MAG: hypothetical protein ACHBNF_11200, partial [Chromatiales bacterium]
MVLVDNSLCINATKSGGCPDASISHDPKRCHSEERGDRLHKAVAELRARRGAEENFEGFEQELHAVFMDAECEILAEELERLDVNQPQLLIDGHLHHRVLRSSESYLSAAGAVKVWRTLYRRGRDGAVVPLELRAG